MFSVLQNHYIMFFSLTLFWGIYMWPNITHTNFGIFCPYRRNWLLTCVFLIFLITLTAINTIKSLVIDIENVSEWFHLQTAHNVAFLCNIWANEQLSCSYAHSCKMKTFIKEQFIPILAHVALLTQ